MKYFLLSLSFLICSWTPAFLQATTADHPITSPDVTVVTVGEYIVFLNAAASLSDVHGLYSSTMNIQIDQSKTFTSYYYFVANGATANQMLVNYNIMQEYRYCNWLEHDSPKKRAEAEASTETGSYDLTGPEVIPNPDAKHHLSNESGFFFAITTKVDDDHSEENSSSPLAMFWGSGKGEEEKKSDPKAAADRQAALRYKTEKKNSSELVLRLNPLLSASTQKGPVDPSLQPESKDIALSSSPRETVREVMLTSLDNKVKTLEPHSPEEESYLAHVAYFERPYTDGQTPWTRFLSQEEKEEQK